MGNQQVKYTITGENLLSKVLKQVDVDAQKAENSVNKVSKATGSGGGSGGSGMLGSIVGGNLIANGISKVAGSLLSVGKSALDSLVNYQYFSASLRSMMHGDVYMAKALESQLMALAKTTPFSLTEVQDGTKQLIAYGFAGGEVVGTMKMLGNVASGVGKPLGEVAYLYGTLKTQGRAFGKDINQFTSAGIPIVKELAKQFKTTDDNVMKLVSDGKVGFKEVEKAFQSLTNEGGIFFNLMDSQSKTVGGQISNLADSWDQLLVNFGKSKTGVIAFVLKQTGGVVEKLNQKQATSNFYDEATGFGGYSQRPGSRRMGAEAEANQAGMEAYASMLLHATQNKTCNNKDLLGTANMIASQFKFLQKEKNEIDGMASKDENTKDALFDISVKRNMLIYANQLVQGSARLLNKKEDTSTSGKGGEGKGGKAEKLGTGVTIDSQAPKNQYITVNGGLVHQMTIESMDGSTPTNEIKNKISTVLVELLNDSYQAMR